MRLFFFWLAAIAASMCAVSPALATPAAQVSERVQNNVVIRAAPSTSAPAIGALKPGDSLPVIGEVPRWIEVELPDGRSGYVSKSWTIVAEAAAPGAGPFVIHAIDVGTGLALFIEGPGFTILYDGGSNDDDARGANNRLIAYLHRVRPDLKRIDHLILSHPHKDHVELLPDLFDAYEVANVWDSGAINPICGYRLFLTKIAAEPGIAYHEAPNAPQGRHPSFAAKTCYGAQLPAVQLTLPDGTPIDMNPIALGPRASMRFLHVDASNEDNFNEDSLVVRLDLGSRHLLLMGDSEAGGRHDPGNPPDPNSTEGKLLVCCAAALKADILQVGHHGSMTSSRQAFISAVGASVFIVSAGPTRYGAVVLPDQVVIDELTPLGTVMRTDANDATCPANPAKIGRDADGQPGGCDNILVSIDIAGRITSAYERIAD